MGYRSDVRIAVAFSDEHTRNEVMAVYSMHPLVQEHNIAKDWVPRTVQVYVWRNEYREVPLYLLTYAEEQVKWYDTYEDVQAVEYMKHLCFKFDAERESFHYAYKFVRCGEEVEDVEISAHESAGAQGADLADYLSESLGVRVEIVSDFD